MKIAFLGDSITEGVPGVSYVDIIQKHSNGYHCINYGVGGDTVISLTKRVKKIDNLHKMDVIVLFVGINDLFGKLNVQHRILKVLMNQKPARNELIFKQSYSELLLYLQKFHKRLIVIPPLLLGENLQNGWNEKVQRFAKIVEEQATFYKNIDFINIRSIFIERMKNKKISSYLPESIMSIKKDVDYLKTKEIIDSKSIERGLHLTLDGVHLNSIAANIIAREIIHHLK